MLKSLRKALLAVLAVSLLISVVFLCFTSTSKPQLTVHYLSRTNDRTQKIAQFGITNIGNAAAISYLQGRMPMASIETSGYQIMGAYSYPTVRRLAAGQGDVINVILPQGLKGRWHFICDYARDGIRLRVNDWRWDAESYTQGFRARASNFIPSSASKVSFDVRATSEWIDE